MTKLSSALGTDLAALAQLLRKKGRAKDSILAHISPKEAALLKSKGGSGSINPDTGLPEYFSISDLFSGSGSSDTSSGSSDASTQPIPSDTYGGSMEPTPVNAPSTGPVGTSSEATYGGTSAQLLPVPGSSSTEPEMAFSYDAPRGQAISGGYHAGGTVYSANPLNPSQLNQVSIDQSPYAAAPTPTTPEGPSMLDKLGKSISNMSPETMARLGLTGGLGLLGAYNQRKAADQNQAAIAQQQAIATPYQQQGQQLIAQAQAGQLSPQSQQAYQAAQAQTAQGVAGRGGVGGQQAANQMANLYQTLLNNQYTYGLQVAQIGDNIATGAIKQGLSMDQSLNASTQNFYTNLAAIAGGLSPGARTVQTTPTTPTGG